MFVNNREAPMKLQTNFLSNVLAVTFLLISSMVSAVETSEQIWIDVRTAEEYQESSILGHPNILYTEIVEKIASVTADKNAPINLYCRSGRRSGIAKETLESLGYTNVTNAGGIDQVKEQLSKK